MLKKSGAFTAKLQSFNDVRTFVEEFAQAAAIAREDCHKLTLVVEELFTNTVRHGHRGDSNAPVELTLEHDGARTSVIYEDTAPKYDSLAAAMGTDIESTIKRRHVGGLGMVLTFALAESAQYVFANGKNRILIRLRPPR